MGIRLHNDGSDSDDVVEEITLAQGQSDSARKKRDEKVAQLRAASDAKGQRRKRGQKSKEGDEGDNDGVGKEKAGKKLRQRSRKGVTSSGGELANEEARNDYAEGEERKDEEKKHVELADSAVQDRQPGGSGVDQIDEGEREAPSSLLLSESVLLAIAEQERTAAADRFSKAAQTTGEVKRKKKKQKTVALTRQPVEVVRLSQPAKSILQPPSLSALEFKQRNLYGDRVERSITMLPSGRRGLRKN